MKHSEKHIITTSYTDVNGILRPSNALRFMEDAAFMQMEKDGPGMRELFRLGYAFVLSRICLSIYSDITAGDALTVKSWALESTGYSYGRCFCIEKDGMTAAEAYSVWALIDLKEHKPVRAGTLKLNYGTDEPPELDLPQRINMPEDQLFFLAGERAVSYSLTDENGHLNNAAALDIFCDFIPTINKRRVISALISFPCSAPYSETLKIYKAEEDETFYFRAKLPDGRKCAEAEIMTEQIRKV